MRCLWAGVLGQGGCCTSSYSEWVALGGAGQRWDVGCWDCVCRVDSGAVTPVGGQGAPGGGGVPGGGQRRLKERGVSSLSWLAIAAISLEGCHATSQEA